MSRLQKSSQLTAEIFRGVSGDSKTAGVTVIERTGIALSTIIARTAEAKMRFADAGVQLPLRPAFVRGPSFDVICTGPDQWLAGRQRAEGREFELELARIGGEAASVFDQSAGRVSFGLWGPSARAVLSKGVLIDLHPAVFGPGSAVVTSIAHIGVCLWHDAPGYEVVVFRSFAESFCDWLLGAAAEYGIAATAEPGQSISADR